MRKDKEVAFGLRYKGVSMTQIAHDLSISKSTLSSWFRNDPRSSIVTTINTSKVKTLHRERFLKINEARAQKLEALYQRAVEEARKEYTRYERDGLFVAGVMLYASEGDKNMKDGCIRLANTDARLLNIFIKFSLKYLEIEPFKLKFWMLLYSGHNESECRKKWKAELNISDRNFYKNQIIKGKLKNERLLYGVGNITMTGKYNKVKLLEWINLVSKDLLKEHAGMV